MAPVFEGICTVGDQQVSAIVSALGGLGNITSAANCMTRLRITVVDEALVDETAIKQNTAVLGVVHDQHAYYEIVVGPGKAKTYANKVRGMLKNSASANAAVSASATTSATDATVATAKAAGSTDPTNPSDQKPSLSERVKHFCKILGGIFVPMIPGFIVSGICGSFAMIIQQLVPGYSDNVVWGCLYNLLFLIQQSLLAYLTAWTGYRAAEQFGATPVLGGMLGMITSMSNINDIATFLGLYNADSPLSSILMTGKGGVLAVVVGVFLLAKVERLVDDHMPDVLKVIGTPLVTMLICTAFYVLIIMPAAGFVASWLCAGMNAICMSDHVIVRIITGYLGAALFLPLVALGMHHGLVALYAIQLESIGYVTLYPALCMAGAGQVGAALAIRHKAKKCGNTKVVAIADA
ncbi:MAG: PTS transporter subunit EIIC, partial [Eggerthellaceae bacterium]|nr:PTS transporter subunit EIIC [Eggerthellaceae bacterium]